MQSSSRETLGATRESEETRFAFGANWSRFLRVLNDERIMQAEQSLLSMLDRPTLAGATFLDIGSGSGLFSLAAKRLGAARVHSFDFDENIHAGIRLEPHDASRELVLGDGSFYFENR